jgi:hypothetical protein
VGGRDRNTPLVARSGVLRHLGILPAIALFACTTTGPAISTDHDTETGSDPDTDSELDGETETETGDGTMVDPDTPPEQVPCNLENCSFGNACVEGECVEIEEPSVCAAPVVAALPQPSANGRVVALDLVDLQQDGDVEIVAWIDGVGVGVLDDLQWTKTEYLPAAATDEPSIAAIHADEDDVLDVLLNDGGNPVHLGLGDGTGSFTISTEFPGIARLRGIAFAPDDRRAFGVRPLAQMPDKAAYLRFDGGLLPTIVELTAPTAALISTQLDAAMPEDVVFSDRCEAHAARVYADGQIDVREVLLDFQPLDPDQSLGHCQWATADFDGDGRDELVARELLHYGGDFPQAMLLTVLPNTTEPDAGLPSFDTPQHTRIPELHVSTTSGDFDGDGDDELLLAHGGVDGGGSLVWATEGELTGCMAELPSLPSEIRGVRTGDVDGDGDDEAVLFRFNGELRVLDFQ